MSLFKQLSTLEYNDPLPAFNMGKPLRLTVPVQGTTRQSIKLKDLPHDFTFATMGDLQCDAFHKLAAKPPGRFETLIERAMPNKDSPLFNLSRNTEAPQTDPVKELERYCLDDVSTSRLQERWIRDNIHSASRDILERMWRISSGNQQLAYDMLASYVVGRRNSRFARPATMIMGDIRPIDAPKQRSSALDWQQWAKIKP